MLAEENTRLFNEIGLTSKLLGIYINESLQVEGVNLTATQFKVLKIVRQQEGICQNDLALSTDRDKTSLVRLVSCMESKGVLKRVIASDDRRKKTLLITDVGSKALADACPRMTILENEISKNISTEEFENLINVLNKLRTNIMSLDRITDK